LQSFGTSGFFSSVPAQFSLFFYFFIFFTKLQNSVFGMSVACRPLPNAAWVASVQKCVWEENGNSTAGLPDSKKTALLRTCFDKLVLRLSLITHHNPTAYSFMKHFFVNPGETHPACCRNRLLPHQSPNQSRRRGRRRRKRRERENERIISTETGCARLSKGQVGACPRMEEANSNSDETKS
jgi:hypothetical protein